MSLYGDVIKTRLLNARIMNAGAAVEKVIVFALSRFVLNTIDIAQKRVYVTGEWTNKTLN